MKVIFTGRKAGAIGRTYKIVAEVKNDPSISYEACRLELYDMGYEHIMFIDKYVEPELP